MESFSRVDIFDTKGIEYLFVIGYLLFLIIFWNVATRHEKIIEKIKRMKVLTASALRIPRGLLFNRSHTWTHLDESGEAKIGLDDFIQHVVGKVSFVQLKKPGDPVKKGEVMTQIEQDGKLLNIYSPISGTITGENSTLIENPEIMDDYPCEKGWIYRVNPSDWKKETQPYVMAEDANKWFANEIDRFKDFLARGTSRNLKLEPSMTMLQDGGELRVNVLSDLPDEVWSEFQKDFLNP